ncbi:MAG TPA: prepilin peptidase [Desulfitobacterium dehalogenans]|uniref:Prepilin leader peptidase/N-methyltransferase n=1 Tax=Desulfitobacterium dehalogenans TaxID=36854 RepID=A0A7C6Z2D8_9FIRM|nr:prepilin peptidase [Desulfitobacterium dehalogenans]
MGVEFSILSGIVGVIIGSLLNVVIYRVPQGKSIVFPGSHCAACGHNLRPWELVPVLSFLILKGRCAQCQEKISWRYPLIEVLNGCLYFYAAWLNKSGSFLQLGINFYFLSVLLVLAAIDWDTYRLPDVFTLPLLGVGIMAGFFLPQGPSGWESLATALGVGGVFWMIIRIYPEGMGLGDIKLIAGLGAFLGFPEALIAIFIASFSGSIGGLLILSLKKRSYRDPIPFGPYLVLGAWIVFFWGQDILSFYNSLF